MKIGILSPYNIFPPDFGGAVRIFNLAKGLGALGATVRVILPPDSADTHLHGVEVRRIRLFEKLWLPITVNSAAAYLLRLLRAAGSLNLFADLDLIQLDELNTYPLTLPLKPLGPKIVVDAHNAYATLFYHKPDSAYGKRWRRIYTLEALGYQLADRVLVSSSPHQTELARLFHLSNGKITITPNGVDPNRYAPSASEGTELRARLRLNGRPVILFLGKLSWAPNREAVTRLLREIIPRVKTQRPDAAFLFVGPDPPGELLAAQSDGVIVTNRVPNHELPAYINAADVCLAPIWTGRGSGTRLKLLEYMACAKPVITTSIAAEGLKFQNGVEGIVEDDVRSFAAHVVRLLADPDLASRLGANARTRVEHDYDWTQISRDLLAVYEQTCRHDTGAASGQPS